MISEQRQQAILHAATPTYAELLNIPGVTCVYPGTRTVAGKETTEECIVVGVKRKLPAEQLDTKHVVPAKLNKIVRTDVVEIPEFHAHGWCGDNATTMIGCSGHVYDPATQRPYTSIPSGVSIGNANLYDATTLGALVRDRDTRQLLGLTTNHGIGPQVYLPDPDNPTIEFDVYDNGYTFVMTPVSNPTLSADEPLFSDYQLAPNNEQFPGLLAGNLYKFNCKSQIHDFYISTEKTKQSVGGGSLNPYTTVAIQDINGEVRYNDGAGTGVPAASAGESLYLYFDPRVKLDTDLWYGSWNYPNVGNQITVMYCGVPGYVTRNRDQPNTPEYSDGRLKDMYVNIIGNRVGHPSNIDINKFGGTGQVLLGNVKNTVPIKFCHPYNSVQPINRIDAATIQFDVLAAEASQDVVGLADKALVARTARVGDHVFKSGRTTGVTPSGAYIYSNGGVGGYTNPCTVTSTTFTAIINYSAAYKNTVQTTAVFENCIYYVLSGEHFAGPGDSGAALLVKDSSDGNKLKLAGIHMAGGQVARSDGKLVTYGIACPVDRVFQDLNLAVWEGTIIVASEANCIKVDGMCYEKDDETFVPITHAVVDAEFDDCGKCEND